jgi:WXG100 family type VII secretion target
MDEIHVQFAALETGQQAISERYRQLEAALSDLERDLAPMVSSWTGAAQQAYLANKRTWENAAAELAQVLQAISVAVGQAHDSYVAAERTAYSMWA